MELNTFKSVENRDTSLSRLDGRVKTVFFLVGIIVSAVVTRWYLALALWLLALVLFSTLRYSWRNLTVRLIMPASIAWLVFLSLLFTNGSHPLWVILQNPFQLVVYTEGLHLGFLLMLRIMAAVTWACVLSYSTPMVEILETLRACKIPGVMVDIADLMARYVFILSDTAHNMHDAQVSRTTGRLSWTEKVRNMGKIAGNILFASLDRSERVYNAMLARGYCEDHKPPPYFTRSIPGADLRKGILLTAFPVVALVLGFVI